MVNLTNTELAGAIFAIAKPDTANQFIESPNGNTSAARIKGVNFAKAKNLNAKQIKFICNYQGRHPQCPETK